MLFTMEQDGRDSQSVNIASIARELGISKTTVSRAISGKGRVSPQTRARVRDCMQRHHYSPNPAAKGLAQHKTYNLGLVIPRQMTSPERAFLRKSLNALYDMAVEGNYDVILTVSDWQDTTELERLVDSRKVDGVILSRTLEQDPLAALLRARQMPFVAIGRTPGPWDLQADLDHMNGTREIARTLLERGARRIALLCGPLSRTANSARLKGYRQAYHEFGLAAPEGLLFAELETSAQRLDALRRATAAGADGVLCSDDETAALAVRTLCLAQIPVPGRVQVASLCDSEILQHTAPPVTAVRYDLARLGRQAARQLMDVLAGQEVPTRVELGFTIELRGSTR